MLQLPTHRLFYLAFVRSSGLNRHAVFSNGFVFRVLFVCAGAMTAQRAASAPAAPVTTPAAPVLMLQSSGKKLMMFLLTASP
jgi:hypothetical protein